MGFELTPATGPQTVQGLPGDWLQIRNQGFVLGDSNVQVIDFVADPTQWTVTRGVGENAHVITLRKHLGAVTAVLGWNSAVTDQSGTPAHDNAGTGSFPTPHILYAGIVGYTAGGVTWYQDWEPTGSDPSPTTAAVGTNGSILKVTLDNFPVPFSTTEGMLTLRVSLDGGPQSEPIQLAIGAAAYNSLAWGPG